MSTAKQQEEQKRNCLARYLIALPWRKQADFLQRMKVPALKKDIKERMRQQLAIQVADMEPTVRYLRMERMRDMSHRSQRNLEWYLDIKSRVETLLGQKND